LKPQKSRFYPRPVPPKSPESKGDFENALVPPFLRGARGDLGLGSKQPSVTTFNALVDTYQHCREECGELLIIGIRLRIVARLF